MGFHRIIETIVGHFVGLKHSTICASTTSPLYNHPAKSMEHHLYHCAFLAYLRTCYLPPQSKRENLLYGNKKELENDVSS